MLITRELNGGMWLDAHERNQPPGTTREVWNGEWFNERHGGFGLTNKGGNIKAADITGECVGYHRLPERNATVFFVKDAGSAIYLFHHDTNEMQFVARDTEFGCDWKFDACQWIGYGQCVHKPMTPCQEINLYWSSGCEYRTANLDELLDPLRRTRYVDHCEEFELLPCRPGPRVNARKLEGGGRDLQAGQYFVAARFVDTDGNAGNWGFIEGPVFICSDHNDPIREEFSRESIRIKIDALDRRFNQVQVAVIPPAGSQPGDTGYIIYAGGYNTNGITVDYYSRHQHTQPISLLEIITKKNIKLRGLNLVQSDGTLHLYRTLDRPNLDYQRRANQAEVRYVVYAVPGHLAHNYRGLCPDENYWIGVQFKLCDGTYTRVFSIPGRTGGGNTVLCGECALPQGQTANNSSRTVTHRTYEDVVATYCATHGTSTTEREDDLPVECVDPEAELEPRSTESLPDCVTHETEQQTMSDEFEAIETDAGTFDDCIDCGAATSIPDVARVRNIFTRILEMFQDLVKTDAEVEADCSQGDATNLPEAAAQLFSEGVNNAEFDEELLYRGAQEQLGGSANLQGAGSGGGSAPNGETTASDIAADPYSDGCGREAFTPIVVGEGLFAVCESAFTYPETLDCQGEKIYGELAGLPIRGHKTPSLAQEPAWISSQDGVESKYDPTNLPQNETFCFFLGLKVVIPSLPTTEELGHIPLDVNEPYRIVYVKREPHNRTVLQHVYVVNTFEGRKRNKIYAVPKNAVNSFELIDNNIDDDGDKRGVEWSRPLYVGYGPSVCLDEGVPAADYIKVEHEIYGTGQRYGLWAEGEEPESVNTQRLDRRGCRQAINLNHRTRRAEEYHCVKGITRAKYDEIVQNDDNISHPLLNKNREEGLYMELTERINPLTMGKTGQHDNSWVGDGLYHDAPVYNAAAYLVALKRINTQQYGALEAAKYSDLGLKSRGSLTVSGLVGDTYVQKYSHRRESFISDKVGNFLNEDFPATATDEFLGAASVYPRSVCSPYNRRNYRMKEFLGFWNEHELPESGDKKAPKNMANLHPTMNSTEAAAQTAADTDVYYWRTLTTLNHMWMVSDINLHCRTTGEPELREIYYEHRHGVEVDSSINDVLPSEAWLDDFHSELVQPSKRQSAIKASIRTFLIVVLPQLLLGGAIAATGLELGMTLLTVPFFGVLWQLLVYNIFTNAKLGRLLGIPECYIDDSGAQEHDALRGQAPEFCKYNYGFSSTNDYNLFYGLPDPYVTCVCNNCADENDITNVVYSSNRQIPTSPIDAYKNFQALQYFGLRSGTGVMQLIVPFEGALLAITTDGVYSIHQKQTTIPTSGGAAALGESQFLESPRMIHEGAMGGFAGTSDPKAAIITPFGVPFIDSEAKRLYVLGEGLDDISGESRGLSRRFNRVMGFCTEGCRDEMNPAGIHYTMGYEPRHETLWFTKHDGDKSFTALYDLASKKWKSFNSAVPDFYFWDRENLYSVKSNAIWKHVDTNYGNYYGQQYPFVMDIVGSSETGLPFEWTSLIIDTEINAGCVRDRKLTFNRMLMWNSYQTTGWVDLRQVDPRDHRERMKVDATRPKIDRVDTIWRVNELKSFEVDQDQEVWSCGGCDPFATYTGITDPTQNWRISKSIYNLWFGQRFEYDNTNQINAFRIHNLVTPLTKKLA